MFGPIVDIISNLSKAKDRKLHQKIKHYSFRNANAENYWLCFYPEIIEIYGYLNKKMISCHNNADIYILPHAQVIIQPDPKLTRIYLEKIVQDAIKKQKSRKNKSQKLNIIGVSLGNSPAFKLANIFKAERLISVIPGSKLPECIWESIVTKEIAINSKSNLKDFKSELSVFSPIENLKELKVNFCEMHLGTSDKMIPYKRGLELAKKAKRKMPDMDLEIYKACGHVETVLKFARKFPKKIT